MINYTKEDFKNEDWRVRIEAYKNLGFTEEAFKDEDVDIRYEAYKALGCTEEAFKDEDDDIKLQALKYFFKCRDILEYEDIKTRFTPEEAALLEFNGLIVNKKTIKGE